MIHLFKNSTAVTYNFVKLIITSEVLKYLGRSFKIVHILNICFKFVHFVKFLFKFLLKYRLKLVIKLGLLILIF